MKIVRKGVFETNSSSAHSLALNINCNYSKVEKGLEKTNVLKIHTGDYGWENEKLEGIGSKWDYVVSSFIYQDNRSMLKQLFIEVLNNGVTDIEIDNVKLSDCPSLDEFIDSVARLDCYIDHESSYLLNSLTVDQLLCLIYSNYSYIQTSNDNGGTDYVEFPDYMTEAIKKGLSEGTWERWVCSFEEQDRWNDKNDTNIITHNSNDFSKYGANLYRGVVEE